jgi:hypothetical protein
MASPATSSNAIPIPPRKSKAHAAADNSIGSSASYGSYAASTPSSSPQQGVKKRRESLMCTFPPVPAWLSEGYIRAVVVGLCD